LQEQQAAEDNANKTKSEQQCATLATASVSPLREEPRFTTKTEQKKLDTPPKTSYA
jgi:hypothetical protein